MASNEALAVAGYNSQGSADPLPPVTEDYGDIAGVRGYGAAVAGVKGENGEAAVTEYRDVAVVEGGAELKIEAAVTDNEGDVDGGAEMKIEAAVTDNEGDVDGGEGDGDDGEDGGDGAAKQDLEAAVPEKLADDVVKRPIWKKIVFGIVPSLEKS